MSSHVPLQHSPPLISISVPVDDTRGMQPGSTTNTQHKPILPSQMNSTAEVCHQHGTTPSLAQHNTNLQHTHRMVTAYTPITDNLIHSAITIHCLCSIITSLHGCAHSPPSHTQTHKTRQASCGHCQPLLLTAQHYCCFFGRPLPRF